MRDTVLILVKYGAALFAILFSLTSHSQILNWAHKKGGSNSDIGYFTTKDLNGNIVTCGSFSSSNVDFDPGIGTLNLSSSGDYDIFVSKVSATGQLVWAFKVGGGLRDEAYSVVTDAAGNVFVTGYFRGSNVDFDPGAGTFLLSSNGDSGGDPGWGGDIFLAKYNSAGQFLWAKNFGGTTLYDSGLSIDVDQNGDVYFGGYFNGTVDFDAGSGTVLLDWNTGRLFLSKYNAAGQYVWAFNFGSAGNVDNNVYGLKWAPSGNIYVTGFYQGSNVDFDPGPGISTLTANGSYEFYLAKYTVNGQFQWARSAGGSGEDVARAMALDNAENIYVAGDYRSASMDFDLSSAGGLITNAGGGDIFYVKYNSAGQNIYAYGFGGAGDDYGLAVTLDNTYAYIGGCFSGSNVDFDPTASTATLNSNGGTDIFYSKYLLNGQYLCAFNIGGSGNDQCRSLVSTGLNKINATGFFQNTNIDFDPSAGTTILSSSGSEDVYVADYTWPPPTPPNGALQGGTICVGGTGQLTFNATAGVGPFTITYNNGTTNIVVNNVQSGVPFNVTPNPTTTTTYTLVSIRDAQQCSPTTLASGTATLTVDNCNLTCTYWPVFGTNTYSAPIPFSNTLSVSYSNSSSLLSNTAYSTMTPGNWFTPNPTIATASPPNSMPHNLADIGAITIYPTVPTNYGTISFASPITTGFYLHVYQTVSTIDFDHSFTLISSDGDLHVGSSGALTNNVIIPDVAPFQSPDDANATIYFPPGISQIKFTIAAAPSPSLAQDGIKLAFTFPDNCITSTTIINDYTPVISLDRCKNIINVGDGSAFNIGDTVLMIQMKGAVIDSSNTSSFGSVTNYKNSGNYEFNYIKSKSGNSVELLNKIERQYDLPDGKVQLIRVPYFQNYTVMNTLSCLPWDGNIGGVLVFNVQNDLTLNTNIDVTGKGFSGGHVINTSLNATNCFTNNYFYPNGTLIAATKGESIAAISNNISSGKGASASAGGGGNDHNSGGGGGGNATSGGFGGYQLYECNNSFFDNRGIGGRGLLYNTTYNKIFMGGGGGAGHCNNGFVTPSENTNYNGGNGGGIVLITANTIIGNNYAIVAKGDSAFERNSSGGETHDGMGGGGAAGTVLISTNNYTSNLNVNVNGGKGGDMHASLAGGHIGPGGGGAGGVVWVKQSTIPANITITNTGGRGGYLLQENNNPYGTTGGSAGLNVFGLQIPIDNILFKPNIDSVRIQDSLKTCTDFDFKGLAYTNTNPIASWQWDFGDGGTAGTQNTSHTYIPGNYTVKLVVTDINGCKDSITTNVIASTLTVNAGNDTTICSGQSVTLQATTNGGTQFQWNNSSLLNNSTILNPVATPPAGLTTFIITASNAAGCSRFDTVNILAKTQNTFSINAPSPICPNGTAQLIAQGGDTYQWQPSSGINSTIPNPVVNPSTTTTYTVLITDTVCNQTQSLSTQVVVLPAPNVQAFKQNDIDCIQNTARLNASGAVNYKWGPAISLNNPNISNPIATPTATTLYTVEGTDIAGCKNTDTISVVVDFSVKNGLFLMPNAFTPNNDGLNDCFGIKHWGVVEEVEFNIYNRWGELIFHTTNLNKCWDGKWKGRQQDPAVFVYWIKAKSLCGGDVFRKGTVVLIR